MKSLLPKFYTVEIVKISRKKIKVQSFSEELAANEVKDKVMNGQLQFTDEDDTWLSCSVDRPDNILMS